MVALDKQNATAIQNFFQFTDDSPVRSFLQGQMGCGWADQLPNPCCGQILLGDYCFLGGDPTVPGAKDLTANIPDDFSAADYHIVPQDDRWGELVQQVYGPHCQKVIRYATKKVPHAFDTRQLQEMVKKMPKEYTLAPIGPALYQQCMEQELFRDFCCHFESEQDFLRRGLGFCAVQNGQVVSGASSYNVYNGGIEIEIITHPDHRRKGLAGACVARLILTCIDKGLYPCWDAANTKSLDLAKKLGYQPNGTYDTWVVDTVAWRATPRI